MEGLPYRMKNMGGGHHGASDIQTLGMGFVAACIVTGLWMFVVWIVRGDNG